VELKHRRERALVGWTLQIVKRSDDASGFQVLPKRWTVERAFGRLGRYRRLSKGYEQLPETSETLILLSRVNLMSRRLTPFKRPSRTFSYTL
jgi:putative transposase